MDKENGHHEEPQKKLGFWGRAFLSVADLTKAIAGIIKEDSRSSRKAYWAYIGTISIITPVCLALALLPGPNVLGVGLALSSAFMFVGAIKGLAALGVSRWAADKNDRYLRDVFNGEALIRKYDAYIEPKDDKPDSFHIRKRALLSDIFNRAGDDVHEVSPSGIRRAASIANKYVLKPVAKGISAIYNRVAGNRGGNDDNDPDNRPPEPPEQGPRLPHL